MKDEELKNSDTDINTEAKSDTISEDNSNVISDGDADTHGEKAASSGEDTHNEDSSDSKDAPRGEDNLELHNMKFKERMRAKRAKLANNMEDMTKRERIFYILSYYKWYIIAAIVVVICAITIPATIYKNSRPVAISYAIVNCPSPDNINTDFVDDYRDSFGLYGAYQVKSNKTLHLNKETYLTEYAQSQGTSDYTEFPMLCFNGYYDIIITDDVGAVYCGMQEIIFPLKAYLPADIYSQIEDRVFETENHDGEVVPFAIDISDTEFAKKLNLGYENVYIGFPGTTSENYKNAKRMIKYILDIDITIE